MIVSILKKYGNDSKDDNYNYINNSNDNYYHY